MSNDIRRKGRTSQSAAIAAASILELQFFTRSAQAQEATGDVSAFQDIASVDGVASVETLDDGRVEITLDDGSVLTVPAGEVKILNGTVFVSDSFLIAQGLTAASNNTVLLLALGAAGVAVAANALESSSDSDDDVVPPVATPPPPMPPVFTSSASAGVAENQTDAYRAVATDADSDTLSYSLSGTDADRFMINAATGEVRFIEAPDFEAPGDADADNVYDIIVTASDGANTAERTVAIMVTDENEAPIFTSDAAVSVAENQTAAYAAVATDADGNDLSYNLSGTDAALFMIDGATGEVRFIEAPDFENPGDADGDNIYDIVVTASDGTNSTDQAVAITVTDENDGTAFQRLLDNPEGASVADFEAAGIERVNALTLDAVRELLQAIGEDDPATLASLTPQQVQAIAGIARDHIVSITGPEEAGLYDSGEFTLGPNPAIVSVEAGSFIVALDYDGDGETDHIANIEFDDDYRVQRIERDFGADNAPDDPPDVVETVERPDDRTVQISYDIREDGDTDRIETYTLDENGDRIRIDVDIDADGNTDRVESYEVDADGNRIQIDFDDNADGEIDRTELDDDADGNPDRIETYTLDENDNRNRVRTDFDNDSDGTIDRTEFDDDADGVTDRSEIYTYDASGNRVRTDFDDNNDGAIDRIETYTLDANGNRVRTDFDDNNDGIIDRIESYTLNASGNRVRTDIDDNGDGNIDRVEFDDDADGAADRSETYTYDGSGNRVRTDFDDNNDGTIDRVDFQDNTPIDNTPIDNTPIDNTPIDNTPIFTSAAAVRVAENQTEAYTAVATDADGDPLTYSLSGTDAALFTIDPATGVVSFRTPPDFEMPGSADGDNVYDITVTASDGDNTTNRDVVITVTDEDEVGSAPVFSSPATASVAENQSAATMVYRAVATDADGDALSYSLSGTDAGRFMIDANTGEVRFSEAPDAENPGDDDGDNVYDIIVTASDGATANDIDQAVAITVTGVNDNAPVFSSPETATVAENQRSAYTAVATDADGDPLTYSLSGTDAALFTIDPATGVVSFRTPPDFEMPGSADGDNVYDITVTASDGDNTTNRDVVITVTDEDEVGSAPAFTSPDSASVVENQTMAYTAMATDADGDPLTYSLSGTDADLFTIDATTGVVSFIDAPDFENPNDAGGDNVYNITVTASDSINDTPQTVVITVTNENDNAPVFSSPAMATVAESPSAATVVYRAVATDADGDALTYSLSGTDAARFTIDANTGDVRFREAPDAENPGDDDNDNVYDIIVTASDNTGGTTDADQAVAITVTDANDNAPVFSSPETATVAESPSAATVVYRAVATDADGDALSYSLSGTDAGRFMIDANTGEVRFSEAPDAENPGDDDGDNVYDIIVTASDGAAANDIDQAVAITVTGVNDNAPVFSSPETATVAENQRSAYTAVATDADGDPLTYSLSGTDAALFTIDPATGVVSFRTPPDFEMPGSADGDNVYDITVTASDGDNSAEQAVAITVTDEDEAGSAPAFTSLDSADVAENQTMAYTAMATDADGDSLTYSLSGTDADLFTIDATTGVVSFIDAPDFENPNDAGGDNVYNITVTASDSINDTPQTVAITVTNENDNAPVFSSPETATVAESPSAATVVYRAVATDADGDALTYSLSGTDAALFTIDANTGDVRFREAPDAENPGDDDNDNVYDIIVTASDNTNETTQAVAITVTNVNDNIPAFTSPESVDVEENQTLAYTAMATDADGDPLTYSLSGTDAGLFTIDPATGEVSFNEAPDAENPDDANGDNVYDIIVTASDGTIANDIDQAVAITVTGVNDNAPLFNSPATASVAENQMLAYTAMATDADGDPLTYSLSGTDAARFTINAATGVVSFNEAPDVEAPSDANGDNVYDIIVTASDGTTANDIDQVVAITVTGVNDGAPVFTSPATANVAENQTTAYTATATDADGDPLTYSLSGTDAALFMIDPNTGVVSFIAPPDFENPGDDGNNNVYDITVTASDGDNSTDHDVAITVTDVNDNAPVFTSPDSASVAENQTAAYTAMATDAEGDTLTYSLSGTDAELFTINGNTGVVSFRVAPDFEMPGDANEDNDYNIIVTASDGDNSTDHDVVITVTDEDEMGNAPVFTSPDSASVEENQTMAYTAMATDIDGTAPTYGLSGADAALFTIDENTGVVSFMDAPDFENPDSATGDNVYNITVTASDGTNETTQAVAITVTNVNDNAPAFTSPESVDVEENQTVAYTAMATDGDGDPLTYSLSGTDAGLFTIDPATGEVGFNEAPDAENPDDANGDNVYDIIVTASDGTIANDINQAVAITVTGVNDSSPVFTSPATASVEENQTAAYTTIAMDADGDDLTYSLSGTDAALFTIDEMTGVVSFMSAPDFENEGDSDTNNVYEITVTASDGTRETSHDVAITVTDVFEVGNAPIFTSPGSASVEENQTMAYTAVATDADGDALTYSLSGTDAARFTIDANTGEVRFREAPDAENPGDDDNDNVYDIIVTASDNTAGTTDTDQAVAITVTDVNDNAPVFSSPATASVAESPSAATVVYRAVATDADGDALTYSLSGTDAARFTIDANTGEVRFNEAPDFEAPGSADGDNVYDIIVTASDNTAGTPDTNQAVAITVTDANDNAPVFSSPATASVAENQSAATVVYRAVATDADGDALSYSLSGTDAARFTIDANTGEVRFREAPDAENPGDDDNDNVYDIIVTASDNTDGTTDTDQTVAITVTGVNDNAPVFSSPATATVESPSAATVVYRAVATDADGDALSYSLSGTDAARFTIDANTGDVRFREAPDAENPGDDDNDNVYDIIVTASDNTDGTTDTDQTVAITVTGVNDNAPVFSSPATATVAESPSAATVVYRAVATDADGDALSYSLSGTDAALFTIDANTGEVRFNEAPDFEMPGSTDGDNVYDIIVTASDNTAGTSDTNQAVAITVTNVNDNAPVFSSPATASVAEKQSAATVVYRAVATDADGDALSYSLSGTDAARFTIDANTGDVRFREAPDAENPGDDDNDNVYDIIVTASDNTGGTTNRDQAVAITVTNVNDNAPVFSSPTTASVAESPSAATVVYRAVATDADGDALTYSLSGTDAALFTIDANTGDVRFREAPDAENPGDDDNDNIYDIIVTASDNTAGTSDTDQTVAITVTGVNDNAPVFSSPATASVAENQSAATVVYRAVATDADGDALSYSLSGTDAARFTIDANTGDVRFREAPDAENPGDDDNDNVYDIIVTASDNTAGTSDTNQAVAITVTDVNDNVPVFSSPTAATVAESPSAATVVYRAVATDADGDALSYSLSGTDAALFTIDANTGDVRFREAPDAENPGDDDNDNVYDIIVTASDNTGGTADTDQAVAITVTNVNDNAPVFSSPAMATVAESPSAATVVYRAVATDADGDALSYSLSGTDAALFTIDANTGDVRFREAPDAENPGDDDNDNVYDIIVTASDNTDGTTDTDQTVAITVTDVNDNVPVFSSPATATVAESPSAATVVYRAVATDADGDALTYSLSGTDATRFTIDANTGDVRFREAPDAENPGDDDNDNVYDIIVTASDNTAGTPDTNQAVAITVTDANDNAPVFSSPETATVAESPSAATVVYRAVATDADGDALSYSLSGTDAGRFMIDANTGEVRFSEAPDAENPGDDDGDNVYDIIVTASDGAAANDIDQAVAITVTGVNDNAPVFNSPATATVAENQRSAYTAVATDADGDPLTYSLSGTDAALFTINAATGVVNFNEAPDVENPDDANGDNVYNIVVTASDNTGGTSDTNQAVAITVTGVNNNAPVFTSPATASVEENQTVAYTAVATDADGDSLRYSLSGTDAALFTINETTGEVSFNEAPDVEDPDDANGDNVYDIIVTASDGATANDIDQAVAITVTGVNDNAPVFTSPATANVEENQTAAYTALATDADGDPLTYSLSGTDAGLFTIDPATGEVSFNEAPDAENPDDANGDNVYDIVVTASDNTGGTPDTTQAVAITVTGVNDNAPVFTSPATVNVGENQTAAYTAVATDGDGDVLSYSLSGTDAGLFTINAATGEVSFNEAPDVEDPDDANGDNVYNIVVTASDNTGGTPDTNQAVAITVTGVNNNAPVFTSPATANVEENQTAAYTAVATDGDGDVLSYSLSGTDAGLFTINAATGEVSFNEAPDAENPDDANGDNVYNIVVTASDNTGGTPDTNQAVAITVTGVNDNAPVFTSPATASVAESETLAYTAVATDADGDSLRYSLSGTDAALFTINETTGEVSFNEATDAENPDDANGDNVYDIIVTASDNTGGTSDTEQAVTITVTDVDESGTNAAPVFSSPASVSVAENQTSAYTAVATDADNDPLTYSLSGTDAALFTIDSNTGVVSFIEAPDFENPNDAGRNNVYNIIVTASDNTGGTPNTNQAVAITVTGVNDNAPVFTSPATANVEENEAAAYTAVATDADGDALSYSLSGTDADLFTINAATGEVSFNEAPDAENPDDANGDNVYDIIVTASDNTAGTLDMDQVVAITVTGVNDSAPVFTSPATASVEENQTAAYTPVATDADGDALTYNLSGTDAGLFTINAATGVVSFNEAPDAENPDDANGDNVYDIIVTASDNTGGTPDTNQAVAITVTNVNDNAPVFTSPATASVAENQTAAYTAMATDADEDPLTYSLSGADAELFTINGNTGVVSFNAAPDFEIPGDANQDNDYNITVTASDGDNMTNHNVVITVTDEDEIGNAPIFTSPTTANVEENQTAAYTAVATDVDEDPLTYSLSGTDADLFMIDPNTGEVRFRTAPDFENPDDAGGDNVYDITVRASDNTNQTDQDVAITVTDEYEPVDLGRLDGANGFTLNGIDRQDYSGFSVSSAGDVNGDGYDDLIIGAWRGDPNGNDSGESYVVYGGASAAGALDLSTLDGSNGFILNGVSGSDQSGRSVSSAGDVNGDGYDDLIIGGHRAQGGGSSRAGEAYVVYGGASAPGTGGMLNLSALDGSNGFTLNGSDYSDYAGRSVSSAGDVNGDGYDDLVIGAYRADPNGQNSGETYVVYGGPGAPGTDGVLALSALDGANGFILNGVDRRDESGFSVSSAGDVNGDGYDDLIIGADVADPNGESSGEAYVVYGGATGTERVRELSDLDGTNGFILNGINANDQSGRSVSSAGDVNGDGYDDLIIGAFNADPNGDNSGETYVVYGGAGAPGINGVLELSALDGTNGFSLAGIDTTDGSGVSVSSAGDVNGDGYDDLIIGASSADPNGNNSGETYVVYGGARAPGTAGVLELSTLNGTDGFLLIGAGASDRSGTSVSSAGDVNGDGYDDLIIGADGGDPNGNNSGETYVVYGGATGTESTTPITAQGTAAADNFTGNGGADSFTGIATADVVRGGAGNDSISVTSLDFADIDGGTGQDTLLLAGSNLSLDLRGAGNGGVDSVEVFDLSGSGTDRLVLDALAVFDLTEERNGGIATLDVLGDADDTVRLARSADQAFALSGQETEDGVTYNVYRDGNAEVRVETGVRVQIQGATAPVFTSPATAGVAENQSLAYTALATDADEDPLTYSLSGTDAALFTIDATTGAVSFITPPDFENPGDAGGDNVYNITVTASDDTNQTPHDVTITVTNENDNAPIFNSPATASVAENQMAAYTALATDADGDTLSYSLSGTDAGRFTINAATGVVRFSAAPDFENPDDAGGDNVYNIIVTASDNTGGTTDTDQAVAITVTDVNDNAPVFNSPATASVEENQAAAYTALATDADGDALSYSLSGTDAGRFTINAATGVVSFSEAPDFENPDDANGDNVYDIIVTASDNTGGTLDTNQAVAITVTGVNDNAPVFTSPDSASVAENQTAAYTAMAADADASDVVSYRLSGGADVALFTIDEMTGVVSFMSAPDFENAGDAGTDNVYEITVTASDGTRETPHDVAITVTDEYEPFELSTLDGVNGFTLNGIDADDQSGVSVSSAGDVNGDGYDDLIIGALLASPNGDSLIAGETYVVYGGASAPGGGMLDLSALDGSNGFVLNGIDAGDFSGFSVSSAGDVNGDGYDDLIIGAYLADPNGDGSAGETYVVYGGASAPDTGGMLDLSALDGTNGFVLNGIDADDRSGRSVSSAGDVNGDGYDDLIIGARYADPNGDGSAGETYLVYGGASAPGGGMLDLSALDGTNGFVLNGIDADDRSGGSVSSAGDVNGDGYDDLIIGAYRADPNGASYAGETYVVYGGASAPGAGGMLDLSALDGSNGFVLNGIDAYNWSGWSVSSAGDVNGDGYDDLIIGAYRADPNGASYAGETYVVYGGASAPGAEGMLDLSALDGTNSFVLNGIDAGDFSGFSVSSAGDVNGDGYDDLIIGARFADPNGDFSAGETYVVYGGASAPGTAGVLALSDLDGTNGFILNGIDADDQSGFSVSSAGDVNGDGYDDLIIGAYLADPNGDGSAGETYVVYGGATGTESTAPITAAGTSAADNFTGNAGADSFTGIATADVVRGGPGDDTISVTALDFANIDGGTGRDTLVLAGADLSLDLTGPGNGGVDSVEVVDLSGSGANTLVLDSLVVFDLTEERDGGIATLDVLGDADDTVVLTGGNFTAHDPATEMEAGTTYTVYRAGNAEVRVETGVQVQLPAGAAPVFTSPATASVAENQTEAYTATATDEDRGGTLTYDLSGTDAALFTIDANTGVVSFVAAPDFETPGDAGGDNVYDIIVTATDGANETEQAVAITVTDAYDPFELSTLDGVNGFTLNGIDAYDWSGVSVSSAGDVNGDGYDDLIIGALLASPNGDSFIAGETYVVYGGASAPGGGMLDLSALDGSNGFVLNGIDADDSSGVSVSSAGDVNGDGYDDLIIGAYLANPNGVGSAGETYVVYGGASAPGAGGMLDLSALDGTNGFVLNGIDADDRSGRSVSSAGDVNGDGYDDLIIGARYANPNGDGSAGETYLVYGGASAPGGGMLDLSALDGTNGFVLNGIDADDRSGISVSSAGDVNGDGYDDLIIGAYRADPKGVGLAGETYVVYGGASAPGTNGMLDLSALDGTNGFVLNGIDAYDRSGISVSSAGDVNGDGYDDLIIGALFADPNGGNSGETYLVYGGASALGTNGMLDLSALDGTNGFVLNGIDADDRSGRSVSSAGDVNGDGYDDLIIGALFADSNGNNSGETYVVYGGASALGTNGMLICRRWTAPTALSSTASTRMTVPAGPCRRRGM